MIEIVQEFVVKDHHRGQFELAFGPGGAWSKLFARSPGFRGTTLMRDEKNPNRYLKIDLWDSEDFRAQWINENESEYEALLASITDWTESMNILGTYRVLAEGTVRPKRTGHRSRRSKSR